MHLVEPALASTEIQQRRAAFIALAVTAEGCADHIRNKSVLELILNLFLFLQCLDCGKAFKLIFRFLLVNDCKVGKWNLRWTWGYSIAGC